MGKDNQMGQSEQEGNTVSQSESRASGLTSEWLIGSMGLLSQLRSQTEITFVGNYLYRY